MIKVEVVSHTPDPELVVAAAARTCIRDADFDTICGELRQEDVRRILATVIAKGHHSVLEHASFTFAISGVSRVLTHQLVRHRIASYSQLSQQRTDASDLAFTTPPQIRHDPELAAEYEQTMVACQQLYKRLVQRGITPGSARYVLPSGFVSRIVTTMNARVLFNLIQQRQCAAEEWEFRQVATLMHRKLMQIAPGIFRFAGTSCATHRVCPEGEIGLNCGSGRVTQAQITNTRDELLALIT